MSLSSFWARLKEHARRDRIDGEFREELHEHAAALRDDYMRRGMSEGDAHRAAMLDIGGFEQARELVNERRGFLMIDHLSRDVRQALRVIRKSPGFATVAVLTLALGIGANAAIFSFIDAVMLRPLPYPESDRLVSIWEVGQSGDRSSVAPANMPDYARVSAFADVATYTTATRSLTGGGQPEAHVVETVNWNYFNLLRVPPAMGRAFQPEEDTENGRKVAIISDALWKNRYGADPSILGRAISLDGIPHEVVGVMPEDFRGLTQYATRDPRHIWIPAAWPGEVLNNRGEHMSRAVGRLRDGASLDAAKAQLSAISEELARAHRKTNGTLRAYTNLLGDDIVRNVRRSLVVLMLTVGLILAIACVNVANLLLARGVGRRREVAVRYALGATRGRVYTALVTESVVLAVLASIVGLALAIWIKGMLIGVAPASMPRLADVAIDWRAIAFTLALSLITGVVFGALPAWQAGSANPIDAMASGGRVVAGRRVMRWRNTLMAAQLALSVLLLVGAGLMIKSLSRLNAVDLGFNTTGVMTLRTTLPPAKYPTPESRLAFFKNVESRLAGIPGVSAIGFANAFPMRGGWSSGFAIQGITLPDDAYHSADFQAVSPGYFDALGIPLLRGRLLTEADTNTTMRVAVVSEAFERKLLQGSSALGRWIKRGSGAPEITIVGVVRDVRRDGRAYEIESQVYLPAAQTSIYPVRLSELAVRAANGDAHALVPAIRSAIWAVDPEQPIARVSTLDEILIADSAERRFQTVLFTIFGVLALVLASIGTYGVIAYLVSQRTPEIGVRMALGASRGAIYRWLMGRTLALVAAATAAGLIASRMAAGSIEALLFDVTPNDVSTYVLSATVLMAVALGACALAVRRAAHIDPTSALRRE